MKKTIPNTLSIISTLFIALMIFSSSASADASGAWTKKYQNVKGQWSIIHDADGAKLVLNKEFSTRKAPDLKFILTNAAVAEMTGENAMTGAVIISALKSNKGEQYYLLPKNFKDYKTLALHCEQYSKLWAATDISAAQ